MANKPDLDKVQKENEKTIRDLQNLMAEIKKTLKKESDFYKEIGVTKEELKNPKVTVNDLPPEQRKLYDMFVKEFAAEQSARKGKEGASLSKTQQKPKTGGKISRKGLRI